MPKQNPFESGVAENFPPMEHVFDVSPSIDTIARTKPADFSSGNESVHTATNNNGSQHGSVHSSVASRSPRNSQRRVAKQLNFADEKPKWREGGVSRATAAAAGWPTKVFGSSDASEISEPTGEDAATEGDGSSTARSEAITEPGRGTAPPAPPGSAANSRIMPSPARQPHITTDGGRSSVASSQAGPRTAASTAQAVEVLLPQGSSGLYGGTPALPSRPSAASAPLAAVMAEAARARSASARMPRSPSAPAGILRRSKGTASSVPTDATGMPVQAGDERPPMDAASPPRHPANTDTAHHAASDGYTAAAAADLGGHHSRDARLEEMRRVLLQPPAYSFTEYLRSLRARWQHRPLARSFSELGVSPSKPPRSATAATPGFGTPWPPPPPPPHVSHHQHVSPSASAFSSASWTAPPPPGWPYALATSPTHAHAVGGYWVTAPPHPTSPVHWAPPPPAHHHHPWYAAAAPSPPAAAYHHPAYAYPPPPYAAPHPYWLSPYAYQTAVMPPPAPLPPAAVPASWPSPHHAVAWPNPIDARALSTASLPAARHLFKYVL